MTHRIGGPRIVVDHKAPEHVQHMATDINDAFGRMNKSVSDIATDVEAVETSISDIETSLNDYALIASPTFTGDPKAPTPSANDNDTSIATTAYVQTELADYATPYVTGTFTPAFAFGGGTTGITYTTRTGRYTRIGDTVHFSLYVLLSDNGSSTGDWTITGLPLTSSSTNSLDVPCSVWVNGLAPPDGVPMAILPSNSTHIDLYDFDQSTGNVSSMQETWTTNTTSILVSGVYYV
jgi:hypothetical protein